MSLTEKTGWDAGKEQQKDIFFTMHWSTKLNVIQSNLPDVLRNNKGQTLKLKVIIFV